MAATGIDSFSDLLGRLRDRYPLAAKCLPVWLLLLPATVWVHAQASWKWDAVAAVLDPLTGAFSAVVIGAVFVDRFRQQLADHERAQWIARVAALLTDEHGEVRKAFADIATSTYSIAVPLLRPSEVVPAEVLSEALRSPPYTPPRLHNEGEPPEVGVERLTTAIVALHRDSIQQSLGPLPWAIAQLETLRTASRIALSDAEYDRLNVPVEGRIKRGPSRLIPRWDGQDDSLQAARDAADRIVNNVSDAADRLRDFATLDIYRPAHVELDGNDTGVAAIEMLNSSRAMTSNARRLGEQSAVATPPNRVQRLQQIDSVLDAAHDLLRDVSRASGQLRRWTQALSEHTSNDGSPYAAAIQTITRPAEEARQAWRDQQWKSFEDTATPMFGHHLRPKRPTDTDQIGRAQAVIAAHQERWVDVREGLEDTATDVWADLAALDALAAAKLADDDAATALDVAEQLLADGVLMGNSRDPGDTAAYLVHHRLAEAYGCLGDATNGARHWREYLTAAPPKTRLHSVQHAQDELGPIANDPAIVAVTREIEGLSDAETEQG